MESSQTLITIALKKQIQDYEKQILDNFFSKGPNLNDEGEDDDCSGDLGKLYKRGISGDELLEYEIYSSCENL